jgi:glutamate racemase
MNPPTPITIGVFDSGFGGLTVLRALLPLIPDANYIYLGDTARLPYGSKSRETIARYAVSSAKFLHEQGADLLVIACNTATALALEDIQQVLPIPVIGVVEPGAQAAQQPEPTPLFQQSSSPKPSFQELIVPTPPFQESSFRPERSEVEKSASLPPPSESPTNRVPHLREGLIVAKVGEPPPISNQAVEISGVIPQAVENNSIIPSEAQSAQSRNARISLEPPPISTQDHILVLATAATVQSHAYTRALNALGLEAYEKACPLLVPLVEEGWIDHPVTDEVLKIYLTEALTAAPRTQTLLLGCTHYPLLEPAIRRTLESLGHPLTIIDSAQATAHAVAAHLGIVPPRLNTQSSKLSFYATDSIEKFQRLGSAFLGQPVTGVRHIDLSE